MGRLLKLTGFVLLGVILWRTDIGALGDALADVRPLPVLLAAVLTLVGVGVKALRWHAMIAAQQLRYTRWQAVRVYMTGVYLGVATPGRLGELARVLYVKRDTGASVGMGLSSLVLDRIYDLYALLLVGLTACFRFDLAGSLSPVFLAGIAAMFVAPFLLLNPRLGRWFSSRVLARALQRRFGKLLTDGTEDFFSGLKLLGPWRLASAGLYTVVAYVFLFAAAHQLAVALDVSIGIADVALVLGLANLLALLPITVAGVGTRDAVFVLAFASLGLGSVEALAFSALVLGLFYVFVGLVGFATFLGDRPPAEF